mgnify:CR=1 FL=1
MGLAIGRCGMGEITGISWTDHTFNIAWGCTKVSPACDNCYAEREAIRFGYSAGGKHFPIWGQKEQRRKLSDAYWSEPIKWDRMARENWSESLKKGKPAYKTRLTFTSSMADVLEDHPDLDSERAKLWELVDKTKFLQWIILTKRPQNFRKMLPPEWLKEPRMNVILMTTVEMQQYTWRIDEMLKVPAHCYAVSAEPLLGPLNLEKYLPAKVPVAPHAMPEKWSDWTWPDWVPRRLAADIESFWSDKCGRGPREWAENACSSYNNHPPFGDNVTLEHVGGNTSRTGLYVPRWNNIGSVVTGLNEYEIVGSCSYKQPASLDWVVVGGESGKNARVSNPDWYRKLRDQTKAAGMRFHFKQYGAWMPVGEPKDDPEYYGGKAIVCPPPRACTASVQSLVERDELRLVDGHWMLRAPRKDSKWHERILDGKLWDERPQMRPDPPF